MKLNLSHQRHGGSPPGVSGGKVLDPSCIQTPEPTIWPSCKELQERGNPKSKWKTPKENRNVTNLPGWACRDIWGKFCQIQYRAVRNYKNQQQKKTTPKQHRGQTVMHCAIRALAFLLLPCPCLGLQKRCELCWDLCTWTHFQSHCSQFWLLSSAPLTNNTPNFSQIFCHLVRHLRIQL